MENKPVMIQLSDAEVKAMGELDLSTPHLYRAPSGFYYCDASELRAWKSLHSTSGVTDADR